MTLGRSPRHVAQCFLFLPCRDIPFAIIYFPLFANLNHLGFDELTGKASSAHSFAPGCVAGSVAAVTVTPLEGKCMADVGASRVDLLYELATCVVIHRINRNCAHF